MKKLFVLLVALAVPLFLITPQHPSVAPKRKISELQRKLMDAAAWWPANFDNINSPVKNEEYIKALFADLTEEELRSILGRQGIDILEP